MARRSMVILATTAALIGSASAGAQAQSVFPEIAPQTATVPIAPEPVFVAVQAAPRQYVPIVAAPQGTVPFATTYGEFLTGGFSVVLVIGSLQSVSGAADVPPAAAKALADLKDFLPYKSYRLLDSAWLTGANRAISHLRGVGGRDYDLILEARQTAPTTIAVSRFTIEQVAPRAIGQDDLGAVEIHGAATARAVDAALAARERVAVERQHELARQQGKATTSLVTDRGNAVIDTSFNMRVGETIVVGTSRLQGDQALIVLLTAVAKK